MRDQPLIGITMGDPAGIGPEVVAKALADDSITDARFRTRAVVIGSYPVMKQTCRSLQLPCRIRKIDHPNQHDTGEALISVLDPLPNPLPYLRYGKPSIANGHAQVVFIKEAVRLAMTGHLAAIVTAPITKAAMTMAGYNYPGHTELLADLTGVTARGGESGMLLTGGPLRIMFVTTHISLRSMPDAIQIPDVMKTIRLADLAGRDYFGIPRPSIGVAGLNPHAGEGGLFGIEEIQAIRPAVERSQTTGIHCKGPFPADTLFQRASNAGIFDVLVAMYHDQGLIPLKLLSFGHAVNITVGLPIIRTSVDHGTAYDIAGQGIADAGSLTQAMRTASEIWQRKTQAPSTLRTGDVA